MNNDQRTTGAILSSVYSTAERACICTGIINHHAARVSYVQLFILHLWGVMQRDGAEGGEAYSCVACLSHSTIDRASLSRRSTVPTPNRHSKHLGPLHVFCPCYIFFVLLLLSLSCFAVCGHHHISTKISRVVEPLLFPEAPYCRSSTPPAASDWGKTL